MKGIFVILDGASDDVVYKLKDKTPLEYAKTPNLDYFASKGTILNCFPIAKDVAPQSSSGIISLFGADFRSAPRGLLEAMGAGVNLNEGDLALRCNFSTVDGLDTLNLVDRRAGRTLTTTESQELAKAINSKVKLPVRFEFIPTISHRGVIIFRGALSASISNVDPSYEDGLSVEGEANKILLSKPTEGNKKAIATAELINLFVRKSFVVLDNHPINIARKKKGFLPANFLLCRDPGVYPIKINKELKGVWMGLGYMPLELGVIRLFQMRSYSFNYPVMHSNDFYEHTSEVLSKAIKNAIEMIEKNHALIDYFYIHFKETDLPGHDNKPLEKVKFIEMIDRVFFKYLKEFTLKQNFRLVVTSDHTTSCKARGHTSKPVPALFYDSESLKDNKIRHTEKDAINAKEITGRQLLSKTLFS